MYSDSGSSQQTQQQQRTGATRRDSVCFGLWSVRNKMFNDIVESLEVDTADPLVHFALPLHYATFAKPTPHTYMLPPDRWSSMSIFFYLPPVVWVHFG